MLFAGETLLSTGFGVQRGEAGGVCKVRIRAVSQACKSVSEENV